MDLCIKTEKMLPLDCLAQCEMTGATVVEHLPCEIGGQRPSGASGVRESLVQLTGKLVLNE